MACVQARSLLWFALHGLGTPIAASRIASFPSLRLARVSSLRERRNSERKADSQRENGKNDFHGGVLRLRITEPGKRKIFDPGSERINRLPPVIVPFSCSAAIIQPRA